MSQKTQRQLNRKHIQENARTIDPQLRIENSNFVGKSQLKNAHINL